MSAVTPIERSSYRDTKEETLTQSHGTHVDRRRILVVEDDRDMAQLTQLLVERYANAECVIAGDSYEAIEALCQHQYDYIILDQNLPGQKGIEFIRTLDRYLDQDPVLSEQSRFSKKIPVLMMSSSTVQIPKNLKMNHFEIVDSIHKSRLTGKLAENFAS